MQNTSYPVLVAARKNVLMNMTDYTHVADVLKLVARHVVETSVHLGPLGTFDKSFDVATGAMDKICAPHLVAHLAQSYSLANYADDGRMESFTDEVLHWFVDFSEGGLDDENFRMHVNAFYQRFTAKMIEYNVPAQKAMEMVAQENAWLLDVVIGDQEDEFRELCNLTMDLVEIETGYCNPALKQQMQQPCIMQSA